MFIFDKNDLEQKPIKDSNKNFQKRKYSMQLEEKQYGTCNEFIRKNKMHGAELIITSEFKYIGAGITYKKLYNTCGNWT